MLKIDEVSKERALKLLDSPLIESFEVGTAEGLKQIHTYLFGELYDFAGIIRTVDMSKGGFRFASHLYLNTDLKEVEKMPDR